MRFPLSTARISFGLLAAAVVGCTSQQLKQNTNDMAKTLPDIMKEQILDNFEKLFVNSNDIPAFVVVNTGSAQLTDLLGASLTSTFPEGDRYKHAPAFFGQTAAANASRQSAYTWNLTAVTDAMTLSRLRVMYSIVIEDKEKVESVGGKNIYSVELKEPPKPKSVKSTNSDPSPLTIPNIKQAFSISPETKHLLDIYMESMADSQTVGAPPTDPITGYENLFTLDPPTDTRGLPVLKYKVTVPKYVNVPASQPADSTQPAPTSQPAPASQPASSSQPTTTSQPASSSQPAPTSQPVDSTQPVQKFTNSASYEILPPRPFLYYSQLYNLQGCVKFYPADHKCLPGQNYRDFGKYRLVIEDEGRFDQFCIYVLMTMTPTYNAYALPNGPTYVPSVNAP
jgi:hypothetical protein